ncbi:hypothetical protein EJ08DRAFT_632809 [Tothia fuscella]|uniref:Trafficking protein particle complex II-specific subunit 65 IgD3 domain-containing protein n=1 Tax=Tothia fuscella TaxID=1048955 RepID=A0A9P4NSZ0_9PEZI|nr:hypothetical protein EJ08DRAFT_632809 [Tothia fuscella]
MTTAGQNARSRASTEFVDDTILEAFVPSASQVNLQELLEAWDGDIPENRNSIVPFIEQRQFLLVDELVHVYVVLRTKLVGETSLDAYLARLAITLEARAVGSLLVKPGDASSQPTQANELLFSDTIKHTEDPTICATEVQSDDDSEPVQFVYVFWRVKVLLSRPKAKIQKLSIYFAPSASLKPPEAKGTDNEEDEYMPTRVPQPINLLGPFAGDPALSGLKPHLSALRLSRPRPSTPTTKQLTRPLRTGPRRLFRAAPAFLWRVRFTRSPSAALAHTTIASVDLEITPFAGSDVAFNKFNLELSSGRVEALGPELPMRGQPGDQITLLFRLIPHSSDHSSYSGGQPQELSINCSSHVFVSENCIPKIKFMWNTPVELPSLRPNSRSGPKPASKPLGPDSLPMTDQSAGPDASTTVTNGVSISITGPPEVQVGHVFKWTLFAINRSDKVHRLAVLAMPKRRLPNQRHGQKDSATSITTLIPEKDKSGIAEPILDDKDIYNFQRNAAQEPTELICLSPDVRIGPLAPSACFTTELKFVALAAGVLYLDSLRVVDLNTQEAIDIKDVPDIFAIEKDD